MRSLMVLNTAGAMLAKWLRLWHTARHLRPGQITARLWRKLRRLKADHRPAPPLRIRRSTSQSVRDGAEAAAAWVVPIAHEPTQTGPARFRFHHVEFDVPNATTARSPELTHLWRYHLHYFDDLNAYDSKSRGLWHEAWLERWLNEFPPGAVDAWDPYPTSLRIVNWIKWELSGHGPLSESLRQSLAVQTRWLMQCLEYHLLGNHLLANAKALVFAGAYFGGTEGDAWLRLGEEIYAAQLPEQILADGGHFELSPMYHAIILEDLLDVANVLRTYDFTRSNLPGNGRIAAMRRWLAAMIHPDGQISFFNDAAFGQAAEPSELQAYAERLGYGAAPQIADGVTHLAESGYVRYQKGDTALIADVGRIGPDYLPGHAHADTLSFELSVYGCRCLVNSGTSEYGVGPERLRQRGTAAHNTLVIDGQDSSEVWSGFRVARRAKPLGVVVETTPEGCLIRASHDGYARLRNGLIHERVWKIAEKSLVIEDHWHAVANSAVAYWHFASEWRLRKTDLEITDQIADAFISNPETHTRIELADGIRLLTMVTDGAAPILEPGTWHPEFGQSVPNLRLSSTALSNAQSGEQHFQHFIFWE